MHMLGTLLEVPVSDQAARWRQPHGVTRSIFSDRCRARLDEAQLRGELATEVHFLSARGHADELSLTSGESEDRSKGRFP